MRRARIRAFAAATFLYWAALYIYSLSGNSGIRQLGV